jgi:hypothetical protein
MGFSGRIVGSRALVGFVDEKYYIKQLIIGDFSPQVTYKLNTSYTF